MPAPHAVRRSLIIALASASVWSCSPAAETESDEPDPPPVLEEDRTVPSETTVEVTAGSAAIAAVRDRRAQTLWVVFPHGAVDEPTQIALRTRDLQVAGLPADAIVAGFEIDGVDDRLGRKARLFFDAAPESQLPANAALFFRKANGRLELLPDQEVTDSTLSADLYHFSDLVVASPDAAGFGAAVEPALPDGAASPSSVDQVVERARSNYEFAERAQQRGLDGLAESAMESARKSLESKIEDALADDPDDPCGKHLSDGLKLSVAGQLLGVDEELVDRWNADLSRKAGECLRGGSVRMSAKTHVLGLKLSSVCQDSVPFIHLDDGGLTGGGSQTCEIDDRKPLGGSGSITVDVKVTQNLSLEGEYSDFALHFEPPTGKAIRGHAKIVIDGPEGPDVLFDVEITENTGSLDVKAGGLSLLSAAAPAGEGVAPYGPSFALEDGAVFTHPMRVDGGFIVFTWILSLDLDDCDRHKIEQQCQRELAEVIEACSTMEDWMVGATIGAGAGPVITCATADCSGAIDAAEQRGDDPFTSIQKTLDKQCDNSEPIICQLECYGWSP